MKPQNPASHTDTQTVLKSNYNTLRGNLTFGNPTTFDTNGNGTDFNVDNMSGQLVRVGAASNPFTLPNFWAGSNAATVVTHNLNRLAIGYIICGKDKTSDVYRPQTAPTTKTTITLYATDGTADILLFIF